MAKSTPITVTGGAGFLGHYVVAKLRERGYTNLFVPRSAEFDLRDTDAVVKMYEQARPRVVIHLAAVVGGIGANRRYPGRFFYDNAIMGIQLIEYARRFEVEKFVCVGTICAYPKFASIPFRETELWDGYPEETNAPYGLAKKMLLVQLQAYRDEYGLDGIYLLPVNLYGPGDNFDPEYSHVIPAIVRKLVEAKRDGLPNIEAWGTGEASREFLYVGDAAEGIVSAMERYAKPDPVNLGSSEELKVRDLVRAIKRLVGYQGEVVWDASKPDGQPRRKLDTSRAKAEFGFEASVPLSEGLKRTIEWYESTLVSPVRTR